MRPIFNVALGWMVVLSGCRREAAKAPLPAPLVKVVRLQEDAGDWLECRGSVAASRRLKLGFKQGGVLDAVLVREGDHVEKGQLLARQSEVDARAMHRSASAILEKAHRDALRAERLTSEGALPASHLDDARTALEAMAAQADQASDLLKHTRLMAPASGTVFARLGEPGETLGQGQPVIVLDSTDDLVIRAGLSEREVGMIQVGQVVNFVPEGQDIQCLGRLKSVASSPNPADGLYAVEIFPERKGRSDVKLRAGNLVRLRIQGETKTPRLSIPLESLVRRDDRDYVFVVEGDRVRLRPLQLSESEGRRVRVREGLKAGELVVGEGAYFLQDGQIIRVAE